MTTEIDAFIEDARAVTIEAAARLLGLAFKARGEEHPQPCPVSGGKDRFSFNTRKNVWHCRHCGTGGKDAIGLAAHCLEYDLKKRADFLEACAAVLDRPIPQGGERESEEDRAAREKRIEERRRQAAEEEQKRGAEGNAFRDKERAKARGIYLAAPRLASNDSASRYLEARGCAVPRDGWLHFSARQPYWHGGDNGGPMFEGPAMVAPFISDDLEIIGCHITWIDLDQLPKCRPALVDPETGEGLPTKKMRGTKKGGLIPLAGQLSARRWVVAEGIENVLAFARFEKLRTSTFYCAAGDLGNLAGRADPKSRRKHPELTKPDRNGKERPVMVAGPLPHPDDGPGDVMPVPDHVDELVLLGDGDSEPVMTIAAMVRAKIRHARTGRRIVVVMPRPGTDFAAMLADHPSAFPNEVPA
ncbi:MAG: P4 alpha zinc-binding domain-containing protein [Mesorhizobium sp.]|nr:P4 alpha zinc-binding domain-containing protein [Mesorhizobium sp.]